MLTHAISNLFEVVLLEGLWTLEREDRLFHAFFRSPVIPSFNPWNFSSDLGSQHLIDDCHNLSSIQYTKSESSIKKRQICVYLYLWVFWCTQACMDFNTSLTYVRTVQNFHTPLFFLLIIFIRMFDWCQRIGTWNYRYCPSMSIKVCRLSMCLVLRQCQLPSGFGAHKYHTNLPSYLIVRTVLLFSIRLSHNGLIYLYHWRFDVLSTMIHLYIRFITWLNPEIIIPPLLVYNVNTSIFRHYICVRGKAQNSDTSFYKGILVVERQSHWHPHQNDCRCNTLDRDILSVK